MGEFAAVLLALALLLTCHAHPLLTTICLSTSRGELDELQTKINYERIACEGEQFRGYSCSRYAMLNNDLVRKKLAYDACAELKREAFRKEVNRLFAIDYHVTLRTEHEAYSNLHQFLLDQQNITITLLHTEGNATLHELFSSEHFHGLKDVENLYEEARHVDEVERSEEQHTRDFEAEIARFDRAFGAKEEVFTRHDTNRDANASRTTIATEAQATRDYDTQEEQATRSFELGQQNQTRTLLAHEHTAVRAEQGYQTQHTLAAWRANAEAARQSITGNSTSNKETTTTLVNGEETNTRDLVVNTETNNANSANQQQVLSEAVIGTAHSNESSITNDGFASADASTSASSSSYATTTQQTIASAASSVQATWTPAAANILGLLAGFQSGIPSPLYNTLSIHLDLIQSYHKGSPNVELYSRPNNINQVRSVVNATIYYNNLKYGSTGLNAGYAANYWSTAESYRTQSNPSYRLAVENYSKAYYYAITPTNANSN